MTALNTVVDVPGGRLSVASWGEHGPTTAALHGFTQRGVTFERLATGRSILAPDLPGHGATEIVPTDMPGAVAALAAWLRSVGPDVVAGYSMGGRIALHVALEHPGLVPTLLLISAGLGIRQEQDRARRAAADAALAATISAEGVEAFIDRWIDHPIAGTQRLPSRLREADRLARLEHGPEALADAAVGLGPAAHEPLHERVAELMMPVVWMAGAEDNSYAEIARIGAAATGGDLVIVPGCGHSLVLEAPVAVGDQIDRLATAGG